MSRRRFEGWYFKHQRHEDAAETPAKSLAVIPGRAADSAFILVITDKQSHHISYPLSEYHKQDTPFRLNIGGNSFSHIGISLDIQRPELSFSGEIKYTNLTPICGDIMGPFRFFPMECRHGVISMGHTLHGAVTLDGEVWDFSGGKGYIESDSGRSFPQWYTWVHCNAFPSDCSIMVSVARIPFYGLRFTGCICVVRLNGREYRLATYKGVKIRRCERGAISLKQGKYTLDITVGERAGHVLPAPHLGNMSRSIRETVSCPAHFRFAEGGRCLLDEESRSASYEYMV